MLNTFLPGSCFGEIGLVIHIPRTATCRAYRNSVLLKIQQKDFERFLLLSQSEMLLQSLNQLVTARIAGSLRKYAVPFFAAIPDSAFEVSLIVLYYTSD